jgi:tetratricopeptide (TPR) repeat protein
MALEMAPAVLHQKEVATGRTVAQLEDPNGDQAAWQGFTPDGTQLVVLAGAAKAIHIWDLRAIRKQLKTMNLDWNWTEFSPARTGKLAATPLTIEPIPADLFRLTPEQRARQEIERYRRVIAKKPKAAWACNDLAWTLLTGPESLRDVKAALPLAEHTVRLDSNNPHFRNTLGVAYYRAGRYRDAVEVLRPNVEKQEDYALAHDLFFLAMTYHRLGERARARDHYDWGVRWVAMQRNLTPDLREELSAFRAEAEQLFRSPGP